MSKPVLKVGAVHPAVTPRPPQDWTPPRHIGFTYVPATAKFEPTHYTITLDDSSDGWTARVLAHVPVAPAMREAAAENGHEIPLYEVVPLAHGAVPAASAARALAAVRKDLVAFTRGLRTTEAQRTQRG